MADDALESAVTDVMSWAATINSVSQFDNNSNNNDSVSVCDELDAVINATVAMIVAGSRARPYPVDVTRVINELLVPIVAVFGIVGNALNMAVLTRKRLQRTMDRLEKSAHAGLVALAVSDALVCIAYFLTSMIRDRITSFTGAQIAALYFNAYREPLLNIFLLSSTWLTVVMAVGRYVAVCRPLHARGCISLRGTWIAIVAVFVGSLLFNRPRFWHYQPTSVSCLQLAHADLRAAAKDCAVDCSYYMKHTGRLYAEHKTFVSVYGLVCSTVGIFIPLPILTACNVCLVRALRNSRRLQQQCRASRSHDQTPSGRRSTESNASCHRITPTLIGLIVLFVVLVGPAEILAFFRDYVLSVRLSKPEQYRAYDTATVVTNFMQLVNFSVNFVLYCVVNVQFRRTCWELVTCVCFGDRRRSSTASDVTRRHRYDSTVDDLSLQPVGGDGGGNKKRNLISLRPTANRHWCGNDTRRPAGGGDQRADSTSSGNDTTSMTVTDL